MKPKIVKIALVILVLTLIFSIFHTTLEFFSRLKAQPVEVNTPEEINILNLLGSEKGFERYQALERIKGNSIDEEIFKEIERILLTVEDKGVATVRVAMEVLVEDKNISVDKKVGVILRALKKEIDQPNLTIEEGAYAPSSETAKRQYIFALEKLDAQTVISLLKEELNTASGRFKDYIYIILGNLGDPDPKVYLEIVDFLKNSKDGWLRASAARSLGLLGNKKAIPLLKEALSDPFVVQEPVPPGVAGFEIYPVREDASSALKLLGVKVERFGHKFWIE